MVGSIPSIVLEDVRPPPPKRRRLNKCLADSSTDEDTVFNVQDQFLATTDPLLSNNKASEGNSADTIVCFGMIVDQYVTISADSAVALPHDQEAVVFQPPRILRHKTKGILLGQLDDRLGAILTTLANDGEIILQLALSKSPIAAEVMKKSFREATWFLGIIVYGPKRVLEEVGDFMNKCDCFLEDPVNCDRNVPYLNPQLLSSIYEDPPMTFDLPQLQQPNVQDFSRASTDILAGFETIDSIEEAANPTSLRTTLKPHQRQALGFFLRRERGLHPSEDGFGIWSRQCSEKSTSFTNIITNENRSGPDVLWRGGLIADEMGLGKTLSMIALIASDKDINPETSPAISEESGTRSLNSTLVIVPLSLLAVWETELQSHVHGGKMTWQYHHRESKFRLRSGTPPPDIVFTTYQTVEREQRKKTMMSDSLCSFKWKRIILDEAHIIRNHNTATARAISALRATSRWAMSGTPIQNNLTDFLGLFKFLHFEPYDDPRVFDEDISALWRSRPIEEAIATFKKLLSCVMIRRTKAILDLPSREDKIIKLPFSASEQEYYRRVEQPVVDMLDRMTEGHGNHVPWMTAIQQINKLRLICNMGCFVPSSQPEAILIGGNDETAELVVRLSLGGEMCFNCQQPIEISNVDHELDSSMGLKVYHSFCSRFYCSDCADVLRHQTSQPCDCTKRQRPCMLQPLKTFLPTPRLTPTGSAPPSPMDTDDTDHISSKVWELIRQIRSFPREKHVVFSSWTSSLDMVERGLRSDPNHIIQSVRIDGKVPASKRNCGVQQLRDDPDTRVMLITIGCGACGLDLTAASRLHLLEPQWNPSLEDQALARVHRLGQTRPVTTIRYVMENSFEEHILKVQDRKKLLTNTLLSKNSAFESLRQLL
ncbi:hypothetical protein IQ07DRAFT_593302 [Pyrenochaeta sp. DS3sAY3a]|nr:hypothetical protein IQ07DRAFT_593302 [Pyrenochaeta sp. DS3sAY3a]